MTRTLRVLHIASGDLWAGAEVQAFTLISHLARMPDTRVGAVLMNDGLLAEKLRSAAVSVQILDERRVNPLQIMIRLRTLLRNWQPHVIHTHREKENILGSLANRTSVNVVCLRTMHGGEEHATETGRRRIRRSVVTSLDRWCARALQDKVIAVTEELRLRKADELPAEKIVVIENGVDVEAVRAENGVAEFRRTGAGSTHIGIAGRLVKVKRVDLFLEAAALLMCEYPQRGWRFHVFGDGPLRVDLEGLAKRMRIADAVTFHGHRGDIGVCIAGLDGLVICSDHEGMPMIALEAAAVGVPTVAHAVGGLVGVVPDEFLVARHDPVGYRDGILRALREDGRAIVRRHASVTVERFSAQRNAERVRAVYEELVAKGKVGGSADA